MDAGDDAHADGDILNGHIDASVLDAGVDTGVHDAGERDGAGAFDPTGLDCYPVIVREEMGPTEPWLLGSEHFCKVISFYASESDRTGAPLPDTGYCYVYDGQYSCGIWGAIGVVDRQSYEEFCAYEAAFGARQYFCERYE